MDVRVVGMNSGRRSANGTDNRSADVAGQLVVFAGY